MVALKMNPELIETNAKKEHENLLYRWFLYLGGILMGLMMAVIVYFLDKVVAKQDEMLNSQAKFNTYIETNNQAIQFLRDEVRSLKDNQTQHLRESFEDRKQINDRIKSIENFLDYRFKFDGANTE